MEFDEISPNYLLLNLQTKKHFRLVCVYWGFHFFKEIELKEFVMNLQSLECFQIEHWNMRNLVKQLYYSEMRLLCVMEFNNVDPVPSKVLK